jgi:hypothetical protein
MDPVIHQPPLTLIGEEIQEERQPNQQSTPPLAEAYGSTLGLFGRFKQQMITLSMISA